MMNRLKVALAIAAFSTFSLTACGEAAKNTAEGAKDATGQAAQTATEGAMKVGDAVGGAADKAKDAMGGAADKAKGAMSLVALKDSIPGLKDSAAAALTAVKAGDFKTAQSEVTKLQESWTKVSDIVKNQSGGSYEKITTTLKTVQTDLKSPNPDKTKIVSELQALSTDVSGLVALK